MRYYYGLSQFYDMVEGTNRGNYSEKEAGLPPLYRATPKLDKDYEENELSNLWLLERSGCRAGGYGYQEDGTFKDPCEFETYEDALAEYKEHFNEAVADYLYF